MVSKTIPSSRWKGGCGGAVGRLTASMGFSVANFESLAES
jgi:hypothetical protein